MCHNYFALDQCPNVREDIFTALAGNEKAFSSFQASSRGGDLTETSIQLMYDWGFDAIIQASKVGDGEFNVEWGLWHYIEKIQPLIMNYHFCAMYGSDLFPFKYMDTKMVRLNDNLP